MIFNYTGKPASFFFGFCLTIRAIYRNQHGLPQTQNQSGGKVGGNERRKQQC